MRMLIVIDMQNDFVTGRVGSKEAQQIIPRIEERIKEYLKNGDTVLFTKDTHKENYLDTLEGHYLPVVHCIEDTDGWEIVPQLAPYAQYILYKNKFGYVNLANDSLIMTNTYFSKDKCISIELIGVCTDICVVSNALILKATTDIPIYVKADCCAGTTPQKHMEALDVMKSCQVEVI